MADTDIRAVKLGNNSIRAATEFNTTTYNIVNGNHSQIKQSYKKNAAV